MYKEFNDIDDRIFMKQTLPDFDFQLFIRLTWN